MNQKTFSMVVGAIFVLIALLHLLRGIFKWEAVIAGITIPLVVSWIAVVVAAYLAYSAFTLAK